MDIPSPDMLLASATNYLIEGQELYEASILLLCGINLGRSTLNSHNWLQIELTGSRSIHEILNNEEHPATKAICSAFLAVIPLNCTLGTLTSRAVFSNYDADWRSKLLEVVEAVY